MNNLQFLNDEQKEAIDELRELIFDIASANPNDDFICEECIDTIHRLLGILTMLTGDPNDDFAEEIYNIIF